MHCLPDHASHSVEHKYVKLHQLTSGAIRYRIKRIYKIPNLKCWPVLMKEEKVVQNTKKLSKNLNTDFRCNVWRSPQTIQDQQVKFC